jgi:hypothetical protein
MIKGAPPEVIASTLQRLHQQDNKPDRVLKRLVERFTALLEQQADPLAVSGQFNMDETLELAEHYDVERTTDNVQSGAKPQTQKDLFIDVWWIAAAKMRKQASTQEKARYASTHRTRRISSLIQICLLCAVRLNCFVLSCVVCVQSIQRLDRRKI